jgi:hypothetical protein
MRNSTILMLNQTLMSLTNLDRNILNTKPLFWLMVVGFAKKGRSVKYCVS